MTIRAVFDTSVVVGRVRRISRGSALVVGVGWVTRLLSVVARRVWISFGHPAEDPSSTTRFPTFVDIARQNAFFSAVERSIDVGLDAARRSQAAHILAPVLTRTRSLEPWQRVTLLGWTLLVATLTYGAFFALGTEHVRVPPVVLACGVMGFGLGLIWWSHPIAAAWIDRQRRRVATGDPGSGDDAARRAEKDRRDTPERAE